MGNKMESSIFDSVSIKGVFWHNKEQRPGLIAGTVVCFFVKLSIPENLISGSVSDTFNHV